MPNVNVKHKKYWPSLLCRMQNLLKHGCRFATVPMFKQTPRIQIFKIELAWILSALLMSCQSLWTAVEKMQLFKSKWHGWFLVYLSKKYLLSSTNKRPSNKEVFKTNQMRSIERLLNERLEVESLKQAMQNMPTVEHVDLHDEDSLQVNERLSCNIIFHEMTIAEALTKNIII